MRHTAVAAASIPLETLSFAFAASCLTAWGVLLAGRAIVRLSVRGVHTITGHLIAPPDPWLEYAIRGALAEFDRELRKVMPRLYGHARKEEPR
ncbi:MAG: hypothetical protein JOY82_10910 [Streptosporangiaceae bacterium]|nr:hypothetical protein [Streptosporangiaceae bacterium]MBV9855010.1 hypothetical protein [Streptosporangiaceae bacterium]